MAGRSTTREPQLSHTYGRLRAKVITHRLGQEYPLPGASVVIKKHPSGELVDTRKTGESGLSEALPVKKGTYEITVTRPRHGPFKGQDFRHAVIEEGPATMTVTVLSEAKSPKARDGAPIPTQATVHMTPRNPRIRVDVRDADHGDIPLAGANAEVSGNTSARLTDANGHFESNPIFPLQPPSGSRWQVQVWMPGRVPVSQAGSRFLRTVRFNENANLPMDLEDGVHDWDIELRVRLTERSQVLPAAATPSLDVWAAGTATPAGVRLGRPGEQVGWNASTAFSSLADLADKLTGVASFSHKETPTPTQLHQVRTLAVVAHGDPGVLDIDQRNKFPHFGDFHPEPDVCLTLARLPHYRGDLLRLGQAFQQNATVYFIACRFADATSDDAQSERLMRELSLLWPTVRIVACRSIVWVDGPVGARETPVLHGSNYGPPESLPWVTTEGAHITIAQDGNIIQRGIVPA
ncbi:MAG: carboxypeptidase-like regulatory domain-containing protein [Polyangiaceae bacterium]